VSIQGLTFVDGVVVGICVGGALVCLIEYISKHLAVAAVEKSQPEQAEKQSEAKP
jgi:hypothetical protein